MSCSKKSSGNTKVGVSRPMATAPRPSVRTVNTYGTPKIKFGAKAR